MPRALRVILRIVHLPWHNLSRATIVQKSSPYASERLGAK